MPGESRRAAACLRRRHRARDGERAVAPRRSSLPQLAPPGQSRKMMTMHLADETAPLRPTSHAGRERTHEGAGGGVPGTNSCHLGESSSPVPWRALRRWEGAIRSPTYTLVEHYPPCRRRQCALHLDLYRIGAAGELEFALDSDDAELWLVEWPERGAGRCPRPTWLCWRVDGAGRRCRPPVPGTRPARPGERNGVWLTGFPGRFAAS